MTRLSHLVKYGNGLLQRYKWYTHTQLRQIRHSVRTELRNMTLSKFLNSYIFTFCNLVIIFWIYLLYWGEVRVYKQEVLKCDWHKWEKWAPSATPHHVLLVADPQLVDSHTYPGRHWPLSSLTITFVDKYIKRSYSRLRYHLQPDTIYFLGDLFDGGREWNTEDGHFAETDKRWHDYGKKYWMTEYSRFANIFFGPDIFRGPIEKQTNIIASLPGNHDLGFGRGVQTAVRDRFQAYFGDGNRVDIIGNHTFVAVDTVSLSAMDWPDVPREVWEPSSLFLQDIETTKKEAIALSLGHERDPLNGSHFKHEVSTMLGPNLKSGGINMKSRHESTISHTDFPTVLMSHVPFFREAGTQCGYQREHWPPIQDQEPSDQRNSIKIESGYQYQNVLTEKLSLDIASKVGNIMQIFSGDDHDYCEVIHRAYPSAGSGIREITVKSISCAMGVLKPGVQLVSLYNPVDSNGKPLPGTPHALRSLTVQTHLCLLPNQIEIVKKYVFYLAITVLVLFLHSVVSIVRERRSGAALQNDSYLPVTETDVKKVDDELKLNNSIVETNDQQGQLVSRSTSSRGKGGYSLPIVQDMTPSLSYKEKKNRSNDVSTTVRKNAFAIHVLSRFINSFLCIGLSTFIWFLYLWNRY